MIIRHKGIKIRISFAFAAIIVLMLVFFDEDIVIFSVLSSLFHESGHLAFMLLFRDKPDRIELGIFGMRIEKTDGTRVSYQKEILIALGGIAVNLILSGFSFAAFGISEKGAFLRFGAVNFLMAAVNSIPVSILDAGRGMRFLLLTALDERKSEKISDIISFMSVAVISALALFYTCTIGVNPSLIAVVIYLYIIIILKKRS